MAKSIFNRMTLAWKLPLMIVGAGGLVGVAVGVAAYWNAAGSLEHEAETRLEASVESHRANLETYLASIQQDLRVVASNQTTRSALQEFSQAWSELDGDPSKTLQRLYIEDNPHPTGQKENLDAAKDGSVYSQVHAAYHPWFRKFLRERGYYDVFLFNETGDLVYTVFKELDYATNLVTGPWRDTDLGAAFRDARDNPVADHEAFFDFRSYAPSNDAPASFISTPVFDDDGKAIGALVFQMPIERLNAVMQEASGLGETGEIYLVGQDRLMRSDSRFAEDSTILQRSVEVDAVQRALKGAHGVMADTDASGREVVAAFAPLDFAGVRWAMIGQMTKDEILAPAIGLAWRIFGITAVALGVLSALGWALARNITRPISGIVAAVDSMVQGKSVQMPASNRGDEIGILARSMDSVYQKGLEATRLRSALDGCNMMVMVANRHGNIVYVNPALKGHLGRYESKIKADLPSFSTTTLVGRSVDDFHSNPGHTRGIIEGLKSNHTVNIKLGGRRLELSISPVINQSGAFLGTVVEWADRTEELTIREEVDHIINAVKSGNFSQRIDLAQVVGVYRNLAEGVNELTDVVDRATGEIGSILTAISEGDLNQRIETDYQGKFGELKDSANKTADQLTEIVTQIQAAASEVENAAAEISSGTNDLSDRTEQAASNLEETAASTEEMAATVKQNADNAVNASQLADNANQTAGKGGDIVKRAVTAMTGIENSAQKITDIISVIDEIAFQTNLLALNASVEAARAGEAGKGFAVVAQEVRQLAQRSAQAASDIKVLIQDSNGQVKDGVQLVNQAGEALGEIVGSIGKVTGIVREISNASQEQAVGIQEINGSITSMDEMTQQNSALVEESSAAARALSDQAGKLTELMTFFKHQRTARPGQQRQAIRSATAIPARKAATAPPAMADNSSWEAF